MNVLALVPNWLGDAAMCTPALRALHRRFSDARLAIAGRKAACELLRGLPWISEIVELPARPGLVELPRLARVLRPHAQDLTVVFPHSFRAALLARLTRSRRRVGYDRDGRGILLTDRVQPCREDGAIKPIYMAREYVDLLEGLGCEDDAVGLELVVDETAVQRVRDMLTGAGPKVGIAPGAAFGPSKCWPADRFAKVADMLAERMSAQCVLMTGPGEEATRTAVLDAANSPLVSCDGGRPSIAMLKAAVSQLDLLVCNDSGARHVAVAFGVPTVCIMGSTSPSYSGGPYERGHVLRIDVDCGPCQKPICETDHRCMTGIAPEQVAGAAEQCLR